MSYSDSPYKVMKTNAFWIDFSEDIQHYRLWQGRKEALSGNLPCWARNTEGRKMVHSKLLPGSE